MKKTSTLKLVFNFFYKLRFYLLTFIASFLIVFIVNKVNQKTTFLFSQNTSNKYELDYKIHTKEVNLIYLGSSGCIYSNDERLYTAIKEIKLDLKKRFSTQQLGFSSTGIAIDWIPKKGISHLNNFGTFNEIITGNSWSNHGAIKYVGHQGEETSTPQVFVILRTYSESISSVVKDEKTVLTLTGLDRILQWHKEGSPLPAGL